MDFRPGKHIEVEPCAPLLRTRADGIQIGRLDSDKQRFWEQ